ncbi:MAG: hypothetical protein ACYCYI_06480 [Saccharofermentanales bacterium]
MNNKNLLLIALIILAGLALLSIMLLIMKKMGTRKRVLIISAITGILVIAVSFPAFVAISYGIANGSKTITIDDIIKLEDILNENPGYSSIDISANRGWRCTITINLKNELTIKEFEDFSNQTEFFLNNGSSNAIIEYCTAKFSSDFVPKKERFYLIIRTKQKILYNTKLLVY